MLISFHTEGKGWLMMVLPGHTFKQIHSSILKHDGKKKKHKKNWNIIIPIPGMGMDITHIAFSHL